MDSRASPFNLQEALLRFERGYIQNILTLAEGDIERTAQMLGIRSDALLRKLRSNQRDEHAQPPGATGQPDEAAHMTTQRAPGLNQQTGRRRRALNHNID